MLKQIVSLGECLVEFSPLGDEAASVAFPKRYKTFNVENLIVVRIVCISKLTLRLAAWLSNASQLFFPSSDCVCVHKLE
jgi:hypothetical protein